MNADKKIAALTLGCKVNMYETEAMLELFSEKGYEITAFESYADIYIINTCTVTNLGDKKSRQMIRRAKKQNPDGVVVAVGCYAQVSPEELSKVEGINIIAGTKDRGKIVEIVENYIEGCNENHIKGLENFVSDISEEYIYENINITKTIDKTRAYLKIEDGCSNFCSYCIIPYARGRVRSRQPQDVLAEVRNLADNGFKEIVLTGIHIASYGKDLINTNLLDLVKKVHEIHGIERIRFGSLEPMIITDEFVEGLKGLHKICDHFHLSLQSGCDKTLKMMNRKYTKTEFHKAVTLLRRAYPDLSITTDIIVGFPGETETDFDESYEFAKEIEFSKIHVFPYSPKKGTVAAAMPDQISKQIKDRRSQKMHLLSEELGQAYLKKFIGKNVAVLFEGTEPAAEEGDKSYEGLSTNYIHVICPSGKDLTNAIETVGILKIENSGAYGSIVF